MEIQREALAFAAGLFEGEGYAGVASTKRRTATYLYPHLSIAMTDLEPLERFRDAFGIDMRIYGPYVRAAGCKPVYQISLQGEKAQAVMAMIWPWLSPRRREQVRVSLLRWGRQWEVAA